MNSNLTFIVSQFATRGSLLEITPLGCGLINDSFKVLTTEADTPDYVLQRINHAIFQDVDMLQTNIAAATEHIQKKLVEKGESDIDHKVLTFIPAQDGKTYYYDGTSYWRMTIFIPDALTYEAVTPEYFYYAGLAFDNFQYTLADLPRELGETIPGFHNMELRLSQLREAVQNNPAGRVEEVTWYLEEIEKRADAMCIAEQLHREGKLPKRVCHCDTKVNNMLFNKEREVLCVIDLDTVMPSFIFSDYGDFLRTGANKGKEDDPEPDNVAFDMDIFRSFTKGYLESARSFLLPVEIEYLPYAATLFPYMQCIRF